MRDLTEGVACVFRRTLWLPPAPALLARCPALDQTCSPPLFDLFHRWLVTKRILLRFSVSFSSGSAPEVSPTPFILSSPSLNLPSAFNMKDNIAVVVDIGGVEWIRNHSQCKMESSLCGGQIWSGGLPSPRLLLSLLICFPPRGTQATYYGGWC